MEVNELISLTLEEEELVERAVTGDFGAFEELILLYKPSLWKYVYRLVNNRYEDANDVVQQILIQVYRALPALENPARFRPWLFTIARNKCFDHLRRKPSLSFADFRTKQPSEENGEDDNSPLQLYADPAPLPDEVIERRETVKLLQEAIEQLAEKPRQVVLLRYSTDLSFAEIGDTLGINENTVKTLFRRAKDQLRIYINARL
jgi:RNA polymerase sigma factor (sigma-70 family)